MTQIGQRAAMVAADRQGRKTATVPPWLAGWNAKVFRSVMGDKPVAGITSVGHRRRCPSLERLGAKRRRASAVDAGVHRPRHASVGREIQRHDLRPPLDSGRSRTFTTGTPSNERFLIDRRNLARVGVVWSPQTSAAVGSDKTEASQFGIAHALVEARIPFEMVYEQLLDREHVDRFKLLILPNIAALSDCQCEQLRQFVQRGGSILATFETSLYDEAGRKRERLRPGRSVRRELHRQDGAVRQELVHPFRARHASTRSCAASTTPAG